MIDPAIFFVCLVLVGMVTWLITSIVWAGWCNQAIIEAYSKCGLYWKNAATNDTIVTFDKEEYRVYKVSKK